MTEETPPPRPGSAVAIALAVAIVAFYGRWSWPHLGADGQPYAVTVLSIGFVCVLAAVRAPHVLIGLASVLVGAFFVATASPAAAIIWLHGALALGLLGLVVALFRSRTTWGWVASTVGLVVGVPLWIYSLLIVTFLTCQGPGCLS